MKRKVSIFMMIAVLLLVVAACGEKTEEPAGPVSNEEQPGVGAASGDGAGEGSSKDEPEPAEFEVEHQLGKTVVTKNPETIVVFDFGILDSLDRLGVEVTGVPQANIPPYLKQYNDAKYTNVGSLKEPDFETIYGLQPDLIIISGRQSEAYDELSSIGPTVFMGVDNADYMGSFTENMKLLGKIFDKESVIEEELASINAGIEQLKEQASAENKTSLIILTTGGKITAYGPGSRFGILHDVFGLPAVDDNIDVSTHGMSISFEYIVDKDPDYLFVIDRDSVVSTAEGEGAAEQVIDNELMKKTKAYQEGNIIYLDPNYWYLSGGGLISVSEMVKEVQAGLN